MKLSDISLLTQTSNTQEYTQLVETLNQTNTPYPKDHTVHHLFDAIATQQPQATALVLGDATLSYHDLQTRSNQLAQFLQAKDIQKDTIVALILDPSFHTIIAMLGILKAGATYLPINTQFPLERIRALLNDAQAPLLISEKKYIQYLNKLQWECPALNAYLCIDSGNVHAEPEDLNELSKAELWNWVGEKAHDDITGGGWGNSYTGEDLSREVMDEYGDNALKKLLPLVNENTKILEIGCASGITMFRLAPQVHSYYGTDLSEAILAKTEAERQQRNHNNITLQCLPAHDIDKVKDNNFDLVIINSVIQCFNGHNYLREVLRKAIDLMSDKSLIFLGDLQDQDKKDELIQSLLAFKQANVGKGYQTKTDWQNELFISRQFLEDLRSDLPAIQQVTPSGKIFTIESELTKFRFDALLTIDKTTSATKHQRHKHQYDQRDLGACPTTKPQVQGTGQDPAYIMYTSGSTGDPKGVVVRHQSITRLVRNTNYIDLTDQDTLLQLSDYAFDGSTFDVYGALLNGGRLVFAPKRVALEPEQLSALLQQERVTCFFLTTALFNTLVDQHLDCFAQVRKVLFGGERVSVDHVQRFVQHHGPGKLVHVYGPTENTTFSTFYPVDAVAEQVPTIPIGRPLANSQAYILDANLQPQPKGVPGELYVSGDGLATGYWKDEQLTALRFIDHPFIEGEKLYKTGDQAKWNSEEQIEFLGRLDDQVKIRGFRIEKGEVAARLAAMAEVKEVYVMDRLDPQGDRYLCAYLIAHEAIDEDALRTNLAVQLPEYMIPTFFVPMDAFPLNRNGKVDASALPDPMHAGRETAYIGPRNETEQRLSNIWEAILGRKQISIEDNFFRIGGHSLKATRMVSRIHKELDVKIPLQAVFAHPTIAGLAEVIDQNEESVHDNIPNIPQAEHYALSHAQKRLWLIDQLYDRESIVYNMPGFFNFHTPIDPALLQQTFDYLIERHESLRTTFIVVDGIPRQKVHEQIPFQIRLEDISQAAEQEEKVRQFAKEEATTGFDLEQGPLIRARLLRCATDRFVFLFTMHHIISDGWSLEVLMKEVMTVYATLKEGQPINLAPLRIQYKDYAAWQNQMLISEKASPHQRFWLDHFGGDIPVLEFPSDFPRPALKTYNGAHYNARLTKAQTAFITELSLEHGASVFMCMLSLMQVLLYKYTGQDDIVLGSPIAGRDHADLESQIGFYVNTLALRNHLEVGEDFVYHLHKVKANTLQAYDHQMYPYDRLVEELNLQRDLSRNPLFDIMVGMLNTSLSGIDEQSGAAGISVNEMASEFKVSKFDMIIYFLESEEMGINIEYNTDLYKPSTIVQLVNLLGVLIDNVAHDPQRSVESLSLLPEGHFVDPGFNDTTVDIPADETVLHLFQRQVAANPDRVAVQYRDQALTFQALQETVDQMAFYLQDQMAIQAGDTVAVMVPRSEKVLVAFLATLRAGGVYLPLDPSYPADRLSYMLADSGAKVLIVGDEAASNIDGFEGKTMAMSALMAASNEQPKGKQPELPSNQTQTAYFIYTSGSTGQPKGVEGTHRCLYNLVHWQMSQSGIGEGLRNLQYAALSFDVSVQEMLFSVCSGGTLVVAEEAMRQDMRLLEDFILTQEIEVMTMPFSALNLLFNTQTQLANAKLLKHIITSGEQLQITEPIRTFYEQRPDVYLHNHYGPSETHVATSLTLSGQAVLAHTLPPIGSPVSNTQIYILDRQGQSLPWGIPGELYIGGFHLANGYINQPELTATKFIPNPFKEGEQLYRTGDWARWLEDGNLEFLGRIDDQVKIRGHRIELGEVEQVLLQHAAISAGVVHVVKDEAGNKELAVYYVAGQEIEVASLRAHFSARLPEYMMPTYFVPMKQLPKTPSGKVDRKALPPPDAAWLNSADNYVAPANELEATLCELWCKVLKVDRVGTLDNFFELGGHSLKANTLAAEVHKRLQVTLPLRVIFQEPTVQALANYIAPKKETGYAAIPPAPIQEYYPLSAAQRRMFLLQQFEGTGTHYNMPGAVTVKGKLDANKVKAAFEKLIERHESLRTAFMMHDEQPMQKVHATAPLYWKQWEATESEAPKLVQEFVQPFALDQAPLMRAGLIILGADHHVLLFDLHHIISDGVSMQVLVQDFVALYQGQALKPLDIQYKDFAVWQHSYEQQLQRTHQRAYWLRRFEGDIPVLDLPTDFPRPSIQSFEGARAVLALPENLSQALIQMAAKQHATMNSLFMAGFHFLLHQYTGQQDIIIGTAVAGRQHHDLQQVIGMFVNTLAIRNSISPGVAIGALLKMVQANIVAAMDHQDYPFEDLVEALDIVRDVSRNPLFDVMFSFRQQEEATQQLEGLELTPFKQEQQSAKFDLALEVQQVGDQFVLRLDYATKLFKASSMERLLQHFQQLLTQLAKDIRQPLEAISLLTPAEEKLIQTYTNTQTNYPREASIPQVFEQQVKVFPDNIAVQDQHRTLTYAQLDQQANQLAAHILSLQLPSKVVGIMVPRSVEMVVGILGILKAGCAYLPLDDSEPTKRLAYKAKDAACSLLLTYQTSELGFWEGPVLDLTQAATYTIGDELTLVAGQGNDLAYILYTSGSTGMPKGVLVEHRSVVRLVKETNYIDIQPTDRFMPTGPLSFDASTFEIWGALLNGASVHLVSKDVILDASLFRKNIQEQGITTLWLTAGLFNHLVETDIRLFESLQTVLAGGDRLSPTHVNKLRTAHPHLTLINGYGPTENTTFTCCHVIDQTYEHNIPIGKPVANTQVYILDNMLQLVPTGLRGEICISGDGLARGYLNQPELTAEQFVPHPFEPGKTLYRTGDFGRWNEKGEVAFLGRIDAQVKIRGFRIELGEIEETLRQLPEVYDAMVVALDDDGGHKYLCAYVLSPNEVDRTQLTAYLPDYMIPSVFVRVDEFKITLNGKLDKLAMPEPVKPKAASYVPGSTPLEQQLVEIWEALLDQSPIGIQDNFFELGGHSLKAAQLITRLQKELQIEVSLKEVFGNPTIHQLGKVMTQKEATAFATIPLAPPQSSYDLSHAQKRIWIQEQLQDIGATFNMPAAFIIEGDLEVTALEKAYAALIERHESLRTTFTTIDGVPQQVIHEVGQASIRKVDLPEHAISQSAFEELANEEAATSFDLQQGPLIRMTLMPLGKQQHGLCLTMHHIISDGGSMKVIIKELFQLYEAFHQGKELPMPPLSVHYKDYAHWQQQQLEGAQLEKWRPYWIAKLQTPLGRIDLPNAQPRPAQRNFAGDLFGFKLEAASTQPLQALAHEMHCSLFVVVQAVFKAMLYRHTLQEDIILGSPVSGRMHQQLEEQVGFYVNMVAIRDRVDGAVTFRELLAHVNQSTIDAFDHQLYPFDLLVQDLGLASNANRSPLFDVGITWQNANETKENDQLADASGLQIRPVRQELKYAKYDLWLFGYERQDHLWFNFEYSTALFDVDAMRTLAGSFCQVAQAVAANPDLRIADIPLGDQPVQEELGDAAFDFNF